MQICNNDPDAQKIFIQRPLQKIIKESTQKHHVYIVHGSHTKILNYVFIKLFCKLPKKPKALLQICNNDANANKFIRKRPLQKIIKKSTRKHRVYIVQGY